MTLVTLNQNVSYYFPDLLISIALQDSTGTATQTVLTIDWTNSWSEYAITYTGSGFTYDGDGNLLTGTVSGIAIEDDTGAPAASVADIAWDVPALLAAQAQAVEGGYGYLDGYAALFGTSWSLDATAASFDTDTWVTTFWVDLLSYATDGFTLIGTGEYSFVLSGPGDDELNGGPGRDDLHGGAGNDTIAGLGGGDSLSGGEGGDLLLGGDGDDTIASGEFLAMAGSDTIDGGDGYDLANITIHDENYDEQAFLFTMSGDDIILTVGDEVITLRNIEAIDFETFLHDAIGTMLVSDIVFDIAAVFEKGAEGDDTLLGDANHDSLEGGAGNDFLSGFGGNDVLLGGLDSDTLDGGDGNDLMYGNNNNWTGFDGNDVFYGGAGDDTLRGGDGNDRMFGDDDNDSLYGGDGTDLLVGGGGDDELLGGWSENDIRDNIYGGDGNDYIEGGYGNDELRGDAGADTIYGSYGVDTVIGGIGDDLLVGQAWSDLIFGGDGMDFINGGFGSDRVNGGAGGDHFFHVGVIGHGSDWIQDYDAAEGDVLQYGSSGATVDQFQVNFAETAGAGDAGIEEAFVIYRPTGQILWALVDGAAQGEINLLLNGVSYDLLA